MSKWMREENPKTTIETMSNHLTRRREMAKWMRGENPKTTKKKPKEKQTKPKTIKTTLTKPEIIKAALPNQKIIKAALPKPKIIKSTPKQITKISGKIWKMTEQRDSPKKIIDRYNQKSAPKINWHKGGKTRNRRKKKHRKTRKKKRKRKHKKKRKKKRKKTHKRKHKKTRKKKHKRRTKRKSNCSSGQMECNKLGKTICCFKYRSRPFKGKEITIPCRSRIQRVMTVPNYYSTGPSPFFNTGSPPATPTNNALGDAHYGKTLPHGRAPQLRRTTNNLVANAMNLKLHAKLG
jgi:hypothetical protein